MESETIIELVKKISGGDENAFDELFRLHYKLLKNYALRFVYDAQVAEDIVQDVFVITWQARAGLDVSRSVRSLLLTMVKNQCLNYLKHKKIESQFITVQKHRLDVYFEELFTESNDHLIEKELEAEIQKSIENLPEQCRRVFRLSRVYGLKNKEIAIELEISEKAVEKQITRALGHLRESLKDFFIIFILIG